MEHIAIDLGSKESQICIRGAGGEILEERRIATRPATLRHYLERRAPSRVIVEAGAEAFWAAELAQGAGHDVRVVPSSLAPALGVGERGLKNDRRDAAVLSAASLAASSCPPCTFARLSLVHCSRGWAYAMRRSGHARAC